MRSMKGNAILAQLVPLWKDSARIPMALLLRSALAALLLEFPGAQMLPGSPVDQAHNGLCVMLDQASPALILQSGPGSQQCLSGPQLKSGKCPFRPRNASTVDGTHITFNLKSESIFRQKT